MRVTSAEDEPEGLFVPLEDEEADEREGQAQEGKADHEDNGSRLQG